MSNKQIGSFDYTIGGKCSTVLCNAKCCAAVLAVSDAEIEQIKEYIKQNDIKSVNRNIIEDTGFVNICPFLNEDQKCNIYAVRPEICRSYLCSKRMKGFNHYDKHIRNLNDLFPEENYNNSERWPNVSDLDKIYQEKKNNTLGLH